MSFYVRIYNGNQRVASGQKRPNSASLSSYEPPTKIFCQNPSTSGASSFPDDFATNAFAKSARGLNKGKILEYLQKFYDMRVKVDEKDNKKCRKRTWETIKEILSDVRVQDGENSIYSGQPEKAGSYSIDAKVGKADEFDWIVPVKAFVDVNAGYVGTEESFSFNDMDRTSLNKMTKDLTITNMRNEFDPGSYSDCCCMITRGVAVPPNVLYDSYIIPRLLKQDLHGKIKRALTRPCLRDISLSNDAHGPALTMTIKPGNGEHQISVDVTISVPTNKPVQLRDKTKEVFTGEQICAAEAAGMHYVPKWATGFVLSYSKVERALLKGIDGDGGCRKRCHKMIKKYVQTFEKSREDGAPGISSYIFKHQLLWMNEENYGKENYWDQENFGERVLDMLEDCEGYLRNGQLPDYFVTSKNILEGKDIYLLMQLADYFKSERDELLNLGY